MAKFRIYLNQTKDQVLTRLPSAIQKIFDANFLKNDEEYNLIIFSVDNHEVIRSKVLEKALRKLREQENIIAVANDFTVEAGVIAEEQNIELLSSKGGSFWTDDSITQIEQGIY